MTKTKLRFDISAVLLPAAGALLLLALWAATSGTVSKNLPSPAKTWEVSRPFVVAPFEKRGELDQGIARFAWYSLILVAKGYAIALLLGAPLGFILGWSKLFAKSFDPIIQVLRPVSPLAWLPLGLVLFEKSHPAALPYMFTGFRLSLGIAWLVIVAVEMLTGTPGIGGFLWQEYNSLIYEHIILCILTIGIVGFVLDRLMSAVELRLKAV